MAEDSWEEAAGALAGAHEAAEAVLGDVLDGVGARIAELDRQARVVTGVVASCLTRSLDMLALAHSLREDHCVDQGRGLASGNWELDTEPVPAPIDTWARGSLAVLPRDPLGAAQEQDATADTFGAAKAKGKVGSKLASSSELSAAQAASGRRGKPIASQAGDAGAAGAGATRPLPRAPKKKLTTAELELEQRLREEIESRKLQGEAAREAARKDEVELEQLASLQKGLKGKDYGYDFAGKVVVLSKVDPEKLPAQSVGTRTEVLGSNPPLEEVSTQNSSRMNVRGPRKGGKKKKGESPRRERQRLVDSANLVDFVQSASDTQPNIMDSMKPNSGVTMREGNNVRSGPKAEVGFGKMTKKDYFNMMGKGGAFEELEHTLEQPAKEEAAGEMTPQREDSRAVAKDAFAELPAWIADGIPIAVEEESGPPTPEDVNLTLTTAADWGANTTGGAGGSPGKLPPLSSPKVGVNIARQKKAAMGRTSKLPRHRLFKLSNE